MSDATQSIFPVEHGKLTTDLDANNLQIVNLDTSNLNISGGQSHTVTFVGSYSGAVITAEQPVFLAGDLGATISGGLLPEGTYIGEVTSSTVVLISDSVAPDTGVTFTFDRISTSAGNDTGTTTAILKGDGNHGFADAFADLDYASVSSVQLRELSSNHDADITAVNDELSILNTALVGISGDVSAKADLTYVDTQLAAKADDADLTAYITSNDAEVALKAYTTTVNSALSTKADTSLVTTGLATKEPLLPTTASDGFVLVRDADDTWRFVDPVTLGSTNATYTDGSTHSNTTFNSTLAVFTTADTGLTIVCAGNVPDDTTITFVNATTVTLSNAATTTASGLTFVILNRFLPTGSSGGTVTSVGTTLATPSSPSNVGNLFSVGVANATTSAVVQFAANSAVGANTFYGNGTGFSGTAGFMSASTARTALGGTTVGQAIFQLANPSQVGFIQTNANNTVTALTSAATLSAIGAESALTFSAPLVRTLNVISIPVVNAANPQRDGYLTGGDYATFQAKVGPGRTITTSAPLTIDGLASADLSANRTIAMPAATDLVAGHLTAADHAAFTAKPPNSRTLAVIQPLTMSPGTISGNTTTGDLSANRTVAIPKATSSVDGYLAAADFLRFNLGGGSALNVSQGSPVGTVTIDPAAVPPITKVYLTSQLAQSLNIILPSAALYAPNNLSIEIIDVVTGGAAPGASIIVTVSRSGSDTVDGLTTPVPLAEGTTYTRFFPNAAGRWFSTKYYVESFKDSTDATKITTVDVSALSTGTTRTLKVPNADSVTVIPSTAPASQFVTGYRNDVGFVGVARTSQIFQKDIQSTQHDIDVITNNIVPSTGDIDNIRLSAVLTAPLTVTLPATSGYDNGQAIFFYDASGSVGAVNTVTIIGTGTDTVNGGNPVILNRPFDNRRIIANPSSGAWTVEFYGTTPGGGGLVTDIWNAVSPVSNVATITCTPNVDMNLHIVSLSANTSLVISGAVNGTKGRVKFRDVTGNHTITVPNNFKTPNATPKGTFLTSTGSNVEDEWNWDFDGTVGAFTQMGANLTQLVVTYNVSADTGPSNTGSQNLAIGSTTANRFSGIQFEAASTYTMGKVGLNLRSSTSPNILTGNLIVEIAADGIRSTDLGAIVTSGSNTVTNATTIVTGDVGQRVTGTNIPDPSYIGAIDTTLHTFTIVTTKGGSTARTISSSGTGVNIWGRADTVIGTSNSVAASTLPTAYSGTYTDFSGFTSTIEIGKTYWIVPHQDTVTGTTNFVQLRAATGNPGFITRNGSSYPPAILNVNSCKGNFITYKP